MRTEYIAHIRQNDGKVQSLSEHLLETAKLCEKFAAKIGLAQTGYVLGLLHDFGKYSAAFQTYIRSVTGFSDQDCDDVPLPKTAKGKIDHSTAGAQAIWARFPRKGPKWPLYAQLLALPISAHHSGLYDCLSLDGEQTFIKRMKKEETKTFYLSCEESADDIILREMNRIDISILNELHYVCDNIISREKIKKEKISSSIELYEQQNSVFFKLGLVARFLLSCLLDADRINSAEFEDLEYAALRKRLRKPDWRLLYGRLESALQKCTEAGQVNDIRRSVSDHCMSRACGAKGIYTLTVPTGGGKTLSSLRFALAHAQEHNLERIIYVIPYTSIIDQNAGIARDILEQGEEAGSIVLEHHSNIQPEEETWQGRLLAVNWESPLIFTTMVHFLEALFASGTGTARRMHALANSVLIFDEIQTLPVRCVHLFCNALNFLIESCGASAVLCTATQPLLSGLPHPFRGQLELAPDRELMPDVIKLFAELRRVRFINHCRAPMTGEDIADLAVTELGLAGSCLIVVNTKKWADRLYGLCRKRTNSRVIYLSTQLCPAHRSVLLNELRQLLRDKHPVLCVSTQLIECGVDLSFGAVIRFAAGLDSILQAAGRCNRHKETKEGRVHIVTVAQGQENLDALEDIKRGRDIFMQLLDEEPALNDAGADLANPALTHKYFEYYFFRQKDQMPYPMKDCPSLLHLLGRNDKNPRFSESSCLLQQSFKEAGRRFHPIDAPTQGIIVPYGEKGESLIAELSSMSEKDSVRTLLRAAQQYTVNIYPHIMRQLNEDNALYSIKALDILYLAKSYYHNERGVVSKDTGIADVYLI
jgi:CRISPR-associated endonuclease/helicase Cas3